ncbi:MAG: site-2 protease family protein [Nocardioidaceae bacterium]
MTASAGAAKASQAMVAGTASGSARWGGLAVVVAGGLVEGLALGLAQHTGLARWLPRLGRARWVLVTLAIAGIGWAAASAPAALSPDTGGSGPAWPVLALGGVGLGLVMGAVLGGAQAVVLRPHVRYPWRWVGANLLAWAVAMPVIFVGASSPSSDSPVLAVVALGTVVGVLAGTALGLVSGWFLPSLTGPSPHNRVVLAVLSGRASLLLDRSLVGLRVRGVRSGAVFALPVMYAAGWDTLVVVPGHAERKRWWRNLRRPAPLDVLRHGRWWPAEGEVLRPGEAGYDDALTTYRARWPRAKFAEQSPVVRIRFALPQLPEPSETSPGTRLSANPPPPASRSETPFGKGIPLGHWAGVPMRAHWSVLVAVALFADILASAALPQARPGESTAAYWLVGIVTALVFFVSLLVHELAHAVTARHYGMRVQRITLWMLGGLTELDGEPPTPRADALIAFAGPAASLAVGGLCAAVVALVGGSSLAIAALSWLASVSVLLGVFNLLPGAPLDGGRLVRALLWWRLHDRARAAEGAATAGRVLGTVLVALGLLSLLAGGVAGLWLMLIGWFILNGAASERYAAHADRLRGLQVSDVMTGPPTVAPDWWTVERFLTQLDPSNVGQPAFPLVDLDGPLSGAITARSLERVPPDQRGSTQLRVLGARMNTPVAKPDTALPDLLLSLHLRGGTAVVVDEDQRPVGLVTDQDLARAARLADLGWSGRHPASG